MYRLENIDNIKSRLPTFPEIWRLVVDGYRQDLEGPLAFEYNTNEVGYLEGMMLTLDYVASTYKHLSADMVEQLHDMAISTVKYNESYFATLPKELFEEYKKSKPETKDKKGYKNNEAGYFGFVKSDPTKTAEYNESAANYSKSGLEKIVERIKLDEKTSLGEPKFSIVERANTSKSIDTNMNIDDLVNEIKTGAYAFRVGAERKDVIKKNVQAHIDRYYQEIYREAKDDNDIILAIATLIHELELSHNFAEANCHTMVLILNKLLLERGLQPTILTNPNKLDACTPEEIALEIKKGMQKYKQYDMQDFIGNLNNALNARRITDRKDLVDLFDTVFSKDPLIQLSQINYLCKIVKQFPNIENRKLNNAITELTRVRTLSIDWIISQLNDKYNQTLSAAVKEKTTSKQRRVLRDIVLQHELAPSNSIWRELSKVYQIGNVDYVKTELLGKGGFGSIYVLKKVQAEATEAPDYYALKVPHLDKCSVVYSALPEEKYYINYVKPTFVLDIQTRNLAYFEGGEKKDLQLQEIPDLEHAISQNNKDGINQALEKYFYGQQKSMQAIQRTHKMMSIEKENWARLGYFSEIKDDIPPAMVMPYLGKTNMDVYLKKMIDNIYAKFCYGERLPDNKSMALIQNLVMYEITTAMIKALSAAEDLYQKGFTHCDGSIDNIIYEGKDTAVYADVEKVIPLDEITDKSLFGKDVAWIFKSFSSLINYADNLMPLQLQSKTSSIFEKHQTNLKKCTNIEDKKKYLVKMQNIIQKEKAKYYESSTIQNLINPLNLCLSKLEEASNKSSFFKSNFAKEKVILKKLLSSLSDNPINYKELFRFIAVSIPLIKDNQTIKLLHTIQYNLNLNSLLETKNSQMELQNEVRKDNTVTPLFDDGDDIFGNILDDAFAFQNLLMKTVNNPGILDMMLDYASERTPLGLNILDVLCKATTAVGDIKTQEFIIDCISKKMSMLPGLLANLFLLNMYGAHFPHQEDVQKTIQRILTHSSPTQHHGLK